MSLLAVVGVAAIAYAVFWASYLLLFPALGALSRSTSGGPTASLREEWASITVLVPARDMASVIVRCVRSLQNCRYPADKVRVFVVADHCTDDTVEQARAAGAAVLVREEGQPGKTYTLAWVFDRLMELGITADMYVVVDATVRVHEGFLAALADRWRNGEEMVVGLATVDPQNERWFARCLGLTLVHRSLQNWSRERLALSALIEGRGMAYSHRYIEQFGWRLAVPDSTQGAHPTEDWRHAVRAVEEGFRVSFSENARVYTPLRSSLTAATRQGVRWERGRMANASTHALRLLLQGVTQRSWLKVVAALDAIQPPVAILAAFSGLLAIISVVVSATRFQVIVSSIPALLVALYAGIVVVRGRNEGIKLRTVAWAPVYIAWRCLAFVLASVSFAGRGRDQGQKSTRGELNVKTNHSG